MPDFHVTAGAPEPLGATADSGGVNFALFSAHAQNVTLCLFDDAGAVELARMPLERDGDIWHAHVGGVKPGQRYGYRTDGPYAPGQGHRFNVNKLLIDPYARLLDRSFALHDTHFAYRSGDPAADRSFDTRDSAPFTPKAIVGGETAAPNPHRPGHSWQDTIIYELHPRGATMRHPDIPAPLRGTLAGLSAKPFLDHLKSLEISAIELLPVQAIADEPHLVRRGLRNYWGYNTLNFFALEPRYAPGGWTEFDAALAAFHDTGIEVLLDMVFNHTGEGDALGPTLSFRGIDNASYYALTAEGAYVNDSGCGNTLNVQHPQVRRLVLDSLRYWAARGVDGFRFDLAVSLARKNGNFHADAEFFADIAADPVLSGLKLIAEPWDAGPGGYQLGAFPPPWVGWNDRFRDTARRFWRGDSGQVPDLATRLAGSSDLMAAKGPLANVNFVTSHDGFTLADLVSYATKHNEANGENNEDGRADNDSWNCGVEGPTDDEAVRALRLRARRNLLATLFFSLGVPMLTAGDELGRSQGGNNNAYCQDNETSWIDWSARDPEDEAFLRFVRRAIRVRRTNPIVRRQFFYRGLKDVQGRTDIAWLLPDGAEMSEANWHDSSQHALACAFGGTDMDDTALRYILLLNARPEPVDFVLPAGQGGPWQSLLDTTAADGGDRIRVAKGGTWTLDAHSLVFFSEIP